MKSMSRFLFGAALIAASCPAMAWNATGHMVVAAIAEKMLKPSVLAETARLLKIDPTDRAYDFITTGPWADDVRRNRPETGSWHYKDIYFRSDGKPATHQPDAENVVVEINRFAAILRDRTRSDKERAEALRFLIHFVADIHQPLHATSRETDENPAGDRGGNSFKIQTPRSFADQHYKPRNLHALWDDGCGLLPDKQRPLSTEDRAWIGRLAASLTRAEPSGALKVARDLEPQDWAEESFKVARDQVYGLAENSTPSEDYLEAGRRTAGKRLAIAGYRLAGLLNKALSP